LKHKVNWKLQQIQGFIQGSVEHFEVKNSCVYLPQYGHIVQCRRARMDGKEEVAKFNTGYVIFIKTSCYL